MAKTLHQKLLAVQQQAEYLQKSTPGTQFKYVSSSQTLQIVRAAMDEEGLLLSVSVLASRLHIDAAYTNSKGGAQHLTELDLLFTWVDAENPDDTLVCRWYGQGIDTGEKGVGKALTYGEKYFLLKFFHIATDADDPDAFQDKQKKGQKTKAKPVEQGERSPDVEPDWADGGEDVDFDAPKTLGTSGWTQLRAQYKAICDELGVDYQDEQVKGALRNYKKVQNVTRMEDLPRDCAGGILSAVRDAAKLVQGRALEKARAELKKLGGFAEGLETVAEINAEIAKIKEATDEN